ncbi:hypothetical protein Tco_0837619 [Tanacetum coccineum]
MAPNRRSGPNNENPDIAAIIAQQLQAILPQIVTQVTNNVNNANEGNGGGGNGNGGNNGCTFKAFQSCNPKEYDGKGGAIVLTRWIEKMENVIDNSGCAENQKVRYAASSLVNKALTWWNTQVQARGREAAMARVHGTICKGIDVEEFLPKYIAGLALEIREMLQANQPTTIQNAILRAAILTNEAVRCGTLTKLVIREMEWRSLLFDDVDGFDGVVLLLHVLFDVYCCDVVGVSVVLLCVVCFGMVLMWRG